MVVNIEVVDDFEVVGAIIYLIVATIVVKVAIEHCCMIFFLPSLRFKLNSHHIY